MRGREAAAAAAARPTLPPFSRHARRCINRHLEVHADGRSVPSLLVVDAGRQLNFGAERIPARSIIGVKEAGCHKNLVEEARHVLCSSGETLDFPKQLVVLWLVSGKDKVISKL